jgi:ankyrin repeat protein
MLRAEGSFGSTGVDVMLDTVFGEADQSIYLFDQYTSLGSPSTAMQPNDIEAFEADLESSRYDVSNHDLPSSLSDTMADCRPDSSLAPSIQGTGAPGMDEVDILECDEQAKEALLPWFPIQHGYGEVGVQFWPSVDDPAVCPILLPFFDAMISLRTDTSRQPTVPTYLWAGLRSLQDTYHHANIDLFMRLGVARFTDQEHEPLSEFRGVPQQVAPLGLQFRYRPTLSSSCCPNSLIEIEDGNVCKTFEAHLLTSTHTDRAIRRLEINHKYCHEVICCIRNAIEEASVPSLHKARIRFEGLMTITFDAPIVNALDKLAYKMTGEHFLMLAAMRGGPVVLTYLQRLGLDIRSADAHGRTALHGACMVANIGTSESLLRSDSTLIRVEDANGCRPLELALKQGQLYFAVRLLQSAPCAIDSGIYPIWIAYTYGTPADVDRVLLTRTVSNHPRSSKSFDAITRIASAKELRHVRGIENDEVLPIALRQAPVAVVKALLNAGAKAKPAVDDFLGYICWHECCDAEAKLGLLRQHGF